MNPLFTAVNTRCRHDHPVADDGEGCVVCEWENEVLAEAPPFTVECIDDKGCSLKEGNHYTVLAVIRDGAAAWGDPAPGLLLESTSEKTAFPHLYKVGRFCIAK